MNAVSVITAASILVYMTGWFITTQIRGCNDIADVAWRLEFVLTSLLHLLLPLAIVLFALQCSSGSSGFKS
jgi:steroid 5-alpha reductase family enzyme